jgi:hypothetical protein
LEVAEVDQNADLEEAQHGGVRETELVDIGRLAQRAVLASVDLFEVSDAFLLDEIVAFLVAAEAEEESGDVVARVLAILLVITVHARDLQKAVQSGAHTTTGAEAENGSGVDVADVEVCIYIVGVRGDEAGVSALFHDNFQVLQRLPVCFASHLSMLAESLVGWPVLFLVIATAVEDHEAAFAGVGGSLGFADCALVFVRERAVVAILIGGFGG